MAVVVHIIFWTANVGLFISRFWLFLSQIITGSLQSGDGGAVVPLSSSSSTGLRFCDASHEISAKIMVKTRLWNCRSWVLYNETKSVLSNCFRPFSSCCVCNLCEFKKIDFWDQHEMAHLDKLPAPATSNCPVLQHVYGFVHTEYFPHTEGQVLVQLHQRPEG